MTDETKKREDVIWKLARGGRDELRSHGTLTEMAEIGSAERPAVIVGMRAWHMSGLIRGMRFDYTCVHCGRSVRLAPTGQRAVVDGAKVLCIECLPKLDDLLARMKADGSRK